MRVVDFIHKTRDGIELTADELQFLINGYTAGSIPDYQMSAWTMAVYFKGLSANETAALTLAMAHSGEVCNLSSIPGIKVDKHSTGGVADTTTLIVAPLAASVGVPIAKMSGRGLGHTGGTIDKLESFSGFRTDLSTQSFVELVRQQGLAVIGQSQQLTPADRLLYALRDVTATVPSIPLIASSIMSKKIAAGADAIVLDVKYGQGAFMNTIDDAIALAKAMVSIGKIVGRRTVACISNMNQPLGQAIGNALEVKEAIDILRNHKSGSLCELSVTLASQMAVLAGIYSCFEDARKAVLINLNNGNALHTFRNWIVSQGGDGIDVDQPERLPVAKYTLMIKSERAGWLESISAHTLGEIAMRAGAGRADKQSTIDLAAGIQLLVNIGERIDLHQPLCILHSNLYDIQEHSERWRQSLSSAFSMSDQPIIAEPVILGWVNEEGIYQTHYSKS
jgi:pyrimidine-nucleoside phosphorylase